jgi:hypothetical protein
MHNLKQMDVVFLIVKRVEKGFGDWKCSRTTGLCCIQNLSTLRLYQSYLGSLNTVYRINAEVHGYLNQF